MGITDCGGVILERFEIIERIHELEREIALLPPGSIAAKKSKEKNITTTGSRTIRSAPKHMWILIM